MIAFTSNDSVILSLIDDLFAVIFNKASENSLSIVYRHGKKFYLQGEVIIPNFLAINYIFLP